MSVSEAVKIIAHEVERQLNTLSVGQENMIKVLKSLPDFFSVNNLVGWDTAFKSAIDDKDDESSVNFRAIELVSELGYENMYVAFSESDTKKTYDAIVRELKKMDIVVSSKLDVSGW